MTNLCILYEVVFNLEEIIILSNLIWLFISAIWIIGKNAKCLMKIFKMMAQRTTTSGYLKEQYAVSIDLITENNSHFIFTLDTSKITIRWNMMEYIYKAT